VALARTDAPIGQRWQSAREEFAGLKGDAGEIARGIGAVARDEVKLAAAEVREGVGASIRAAIWTGIAAVVGLVTLVWIPVAILLCLGEAMPLWAASLVTVGLLLVASLLVTLICVRQFKQVNFVPKQALQRMKEDKEWLMGQRSDSPS
jgi:uncharacterized membrane protein YqjE